jgi:hypothetical protein
MLIPLAFRRNYPILFLDFNHLPLEAFMYRFTIVVCFIFLVLFTSLALADIPKLINYQGMLTDDGGNPLNDTVSMIFKIYNDSLSLDPGDKKWEETQTGVEVTNGLFNVMLGQVSPLNLDFSEDYWLDITVGAEHLPDRIRLTSVSYAYRARNADTASYAIEAVSAESDSDWTVSGDHMYSALSGNVGIGTAPPAYKLHVAGQVISGANNDASGEYSAIGGGHDNSAVGDRSVIGGGQDNVASSSFATVSGGWANKASLQYAAVGGGGHNVASGDHSTVGGGEVDSATGGYATVSGGGYNTAGAVAATVGGGQNNKATAGRATVSGGYQNDASDVEATVAGGQFNTASGAQSVVAGGEHNLASGWRSVISGGYGDTASAMYTTVSGGRNNVATVAHATVGGGAENRATNNSTTVAGGYQNQASGYNSTVSGGIQNSATGYGSMVAGGAYNHAGGVWSYAAGYRAKAIHDGTFVWADSTEADFSSTAADQFLIRASGGVGIGTASPGQQLDIDLGHMIVQGPGSFDSNGEEGIVFLGSVHHYIKGVYGFGVKIGTYAAGDVVSIEEISGNVGIGTTNPQGYKLFVDGTAAKPGGGTWDNPSDIRLKRVNAAYECGLSEISQLTPTHYNYREGNELGLPTQREYVGLVAQDVQNVIPDAVSENEQGYLMLNSDPIIWAMLNAIKELKTENEELKQRIEALESR